jgi:hypothetical protein
MRCGAARATAAPTGTSRLELTALLTGIICGVTAFRIYPLVVSTEQVPVALTIGLALVPLAWA